MQGKTIDRAKFFSGVRPIFAGGKLNQGQVDGMNAILAAWDESVFSDLRWLAYMLATAYHETGGFMLPIGERGGYDYCERMYGPDGRRPETARKMGNIHIGDGFKYRGRGYVQMTWCINYRHAGEITGVNLVGNPDLAMRPDIAAKVMFAGMTDARVIFQDFSDDRNFTFTGRSLEDYFNDDVEDPYNARRIINGTDHAQVIADTYEDFLPALAYQA
jgi:putative chitinase